MMDWMVTVGVPRWGAQDRSIPRYFTRTHKENQGSNAGWRTWALGLTAFSIRTC